MLLARWVGICLDTTQGSYLTTLGRIALKSKSTHQVLEALVNLVVLGSVKTACRQIERITLKWIVE